VLRKCCLKFRELYMDLSDGLCPFVSGITLANIVNVLWRTKFLKSKTIGILSRLGNGQKRRQSNKALKWLEWESRECGKEIQTSVAGGEKRIGRYFVDGFLYKLTRVRMNLILCLFCFDN